MYTVSEVNLKYSKSKFKADLYFHQENENKTRVFPLQSQFSLFFALSSTILASVSKGILHDKMSMSQSMRVKKTNHHISQRRFILFYPHFFHELMLHYIIFFSYKDYILVAYHIKLLLITEFFFSLSHSQRPESS